MPIRFRCPKCRQLLGISGRKGGTLVKCPTCASQVEVPRGEGEGEPSVKPEGAPLLFERTDFDDHFKVPRSDQARPKAKVKLATPERPELRSPASAPRGSPKPAPPSLPSPVAPRSLQESAVEVEWVALPGQDGKNVELAAERVGIVLSPVMATIAGVIFVVGIISAFAAGLLLGYLLFKPAGADVGTGRQEVLHHATGPISLSAPSRRCAGIRKLPDL